MAEHPPARRRWLQFGLSTLVILTLVAALFCGYTAYWMGRVREVQNENAALKKQLQVQQQMADDLRMLRRLEEVRLQNVSFGAQRPLPGEGGDR